MVVKPPEEGLEAEAAGDATAGMESRNFDRLDEIESAKHAVKIAVHRALAWLVPLSVGFAFVLFWIGIIVYAFMFTNYGWLPEVRLQELRTILFSSVLGAIVAKGIKNYLD
jgi:hypothetical protein